MQYLALGALCACLLPAALAQEARLLSQQPEGRLSLEGETRLEIQGWSGEIVLRETGSAELDFGCSVLGGGNPCAVELWSASKTLLLRLPAEASPQPRSLDVGVPANLDVAIAATGCRVAARSMSGRLEVRGERVDLEVWAPRGDLQVDVAEGSVVVQHAMRAMALGGSGLMVRVLRGTGPLRLDLASSEAEVEGLSGAIDGEIEGGVLRIRGGEGDVDLRSAHGGSVSLGERIGAARFDLDGATLEVERARGRLDVTSDRIVQVRDHEGDVTVEGRIPELRAERVTGSLVGSLQAPANVSVSDVRGAVRIEGDELRARMSRIVGELTLRAERGELDVDWPAGSVAVRNGSGDTRVRHAQERVTIEQEGGSVRCEELLGPVDVRASAEELHIVWSGLGGTWDSTIENRDGPVSVLFPAGARFALHARSEYGEVESSLPRVTLSEDGGSVSGVVGGPGGPKIVIRASDTITLAVGGPS